MERHEAMGLWLRAPPTPRLGRDIGFQALDGRVMIMMLVVRLVVVLQKFHNPESQ